MQLLSDNLVTPNEIFFIRNHLPVPDIDENIYELEITGEGINTVTLSLEVIYIWVEILKGVCPANVPVWLWLTLEDPLESFLP